MKSNTKDLVKFRRLKMMMLSPEYHVIGLLESLWLFTAKNAPLGDVGKYKDNDIAAMVDWKGSAAELIEMLVDSGWIDEHPDHRLVIHDWHDHAPNYVKANVKQHMGGRWASLAGRKDSPNAPPKDSPKDSPKDGPKGSPKDGPSDTPTKSSQVKSSQTKPNQVKVSLESAAPLTSWRFPVVGGEMKPDGSRELMWGLTLELYDMLVDCYPDIDVDSQLRQVTAYLATSPKKTPGGMSRFLTSWMNRTQNWGGSTAGKNKREPLQLDENDDSD